GGPGSGHPAAEQRRAEHGAFQARLAVDVPAGHAGELSGGVQAWNRLEVLIEHLAAQVGLDATKVLAGQRHVMQGIERRHRDLLPALERTLAYRVDRKSVV